MPTVRIGEADIHYEEFGSGFPVLGLAPGGLRSTIALWKVTPEGHPAYWFDPTVELARHFRFITLDQRNAGASRAPVKATDGWETYAADHLGLMDHLGIDRFHIIGGCIGVSFAFTLCKLARHRVVAAIMQNPIGRNAENQGPRMEGYGLWAKALRASRPELDEAALERFGRTLYDADFIFSVDRDFVRHCDVPMLVMPGSDDLPHPTATGIEIAELAPNAELMLDWKGPAHMAEQIRRSVDFLRRHTPA